MGSLPALVAPSKPRLNDQSPKQPIGRPKNGQRLCPGRSRRPSDWSARSDDNGSVVARFRAEVRSYTEPGPPALYCGHEQARVEHAANLARQLLGREGFLQKGRVTLQHSAAEDVIVGVA